jgi:hypothetical protein
MACNDNLGGCFTCESRINYLINSLNYAPSAACGKVGYEQFMIACGGCMPDELRSPGRYSWRFENVDDNHAIGSLLVA